MRILYVQASLVPPPDDPRMDRFMLLSETLEGDVLQPVWFRSPEDVEAAFGSGSYPVYVRGKFRYHWFLAQRYRGMRQRVETFRFYIQTGLRLYRERRFDCIVAYSHMTTGIVAGLVKLLTGAKLVIEIATCPELIYLTDSPQPSLKNRLRHLYSDICLHLSMRMADRAHFLFPDQLFAYPSLRAMRNSVFHEFVPMSSVVRRNLDGDAGSPFVLLVGAPWYLKGADLLIRAFQRIATEFPGLRLKLLGHFPDSSQMETLIGDSANIEILKAIRHPETLELISRATVLVLPSRCEGMGRVLIEAMAAGVPVLGSDVGGIPFVIRDGECGLTFPKGDAHALENKLRELLTDSAMRHRMGEEGYRQAHSRFSEAVYVEEFTRMVNAAIQGAA